jgi:lysophospholipase L1-like esterase
MKAIVFILFFFTYSSSCKKTNMPQEIKPPITNPSSTDNDTSLVAGDYTYLALGDSYTIGHGVPENENYPTQTTALLRKHNLQGKAKIIAVTGWTTDNLQQGITNATSRGELSASYDIVTLLIGVNNQYQGQRSADYRPKFEILLKQAIALAGNTASHVIVISIPDWGVTPFADGRDRTEIAKEIDEYNAINEELAGTYGAAYLNVTEWTREAATDLTLLAGDKLHPSGKEYARWAETLYPMIENILR